jgi:hypothetical protein
MHLDQRLGFARRLKLQFAADDPLPCLQRPPGELSIGGPILGAGHAVVNEIRNGSGGIEG